jgi:outer membrane autotransporter protein
MCTAWSPTLPQQALCRAGPAHWGLSGCSAGGYWTHYGPGGWYLDAVLQGTYYNGSAITQFANLPINGSGFISSLEGGYPIPLPLGPRFVLEPQAQIIWQEVSFNHANDGLGPVGLGTTSGPTGRVGLRGMWTIDGYNGQVWQPYVRANLWRDWGAEATTLFGIDPVPLIEQATRLEFAGGVTALLGRGVSLYAQAGYQFGLDGAFIRNGVQGDIGLRFVW